MPASVRHRAEHRHSQRHGHRQCADDAVILPTNDDICVLIFGDTIVCRFSDQQQTHSPTKSSAGAPVRVRTPIWCSRRSTTPSGPATSATSAASETGS
ncbi:hypothetical protein EEB14_33910 [Rhodococcus sp. WS4]|nr:hypothetical protein EEB14_33910 [Rhodococcus sp. WS4]